MVFSLHTFPIFPCQRGCIKERDIRCITSLFITHVHVNRLLSCWTSAFASGWIRPSASEGCGETRSSSGWARNTIAAALSCDVALFNWCSLSKFFHAKSIWRLIFIARSSEIRRLLLTSFILPIRFLTAASCTLGYFPAKFVLKLYPFSRLVLYYALSS